MVKGKRIIGKGVLNPIQKQITYLPFFTNWRTSLNFIHVLSKQYIFIGNFLAHSSFEIHRWFPFTSCTRFWSHFDFVWNVTPSSQAQLFLRDLLTFRPSLLKQSQPKINRSLSNWCYTALVQPKLRKPLLFRTVDKKIFVKFTFLRWPRVAASDVTVLWGIPLKRIWRENYRLSQIIRICMGIYRKINKTGKMHIIDINSHQSVNAS